MKILIIPTSDWVGHPFPSRLHHIFERVHGRHEVNVVRFGFYRRKRLKTNVILHEIHDRAAGNLPLYYFLNTDRFLGRIKRIVKENEIEVVILSNLYPAYIAANLLQQKHILCFDLPDYLPASAAGYSMDVCSSVGKVLIALYQELLRRTVQKTRLVVACSHLLEGYARRLGALRTKLIPNGVDEAFFNNYQREAQTIKEKLQLEDYTVLGYIGSIEFWLDMEHLLRAIRLAINRGFKLKLLLIGRELWTGYAERVRKWIEELHLTEHIIWLNFILYTDVPKYIAAMDLCLIPFNIHHPVAFYSAPNKLWEFLAQGKMVISTPIPEVLHRAGDCVTYASSTAEYLTAIESYVMGNGDFVEKARKGREEAKNYTWQALSRTYLESLKEASSMLRR